LILAEVIIIKTVG